MVCVCADTPPAPGFAWLNPPAPGDPIWNSLAIDACRTRCRRRGRHGRGGAVEVDASAITAGGYEGREQHSRDPKACVVTH